MEYAKRLEFEEKVIMPFSCITEANSWYRPVSGLPMLIFAQRKFRNAYDNRIFEEESEKFHSVVNSSNKQSSSTERTKVGGKAMKRTWKLSKEPVSAGFGKNETEASVKKRQCPLLLYKIAHEVSLGVGRESGCSHIPLSAVITQISARSASIQSVVLYPTRALFKEDSVAFPDLPKRVNKDNIRCVCVCDAVDHKLRHAITPLEVEVWSLGSGTKLRSRTKILSSVKFEEGTHGLTVNITFATPPEPQSNSTRNYHSSNRRRNLFNLLNMLMETVKLILSSFAARE
ncbi:hypothetical protein CBL_00882 [Carabus blaptoides fortunei]